MWWLRSTKQARLSIEEKQQGRLRDLRDEVLQLHPAIPQRQAPCRAEPTLAYAEKYIVDGATN